jgi:hypothetical protein
MRAQTVLLSLKNSIQPEVLDREVEAPLIKLKIGTLIKVQYLRLCQKKTKRRIMNTIILRVISRDSNLRCIKIIMRKRLRSMAMRMMMR